MNRKESLLAGIDLANASGLEIGALNHPLVRKSEGDIYYVDYADTDFLRQRYANDPNVDTAAIVETDYVWGERDLDQITNGRKFDFIVASHVIEHVPDLITWLNELSAVLKPGGTIRLAIPDKRFTFDCLRQDSTLADAIEARLKRYRRPSARAIFDCQYNLVTVDHQAIWRGDQNPVDLARTVSFEAAYATARRAVDSEAYEDSHCWVFTPLSFTRLMGEFATHGLVQLGCTSLIPTRRDDIEFFVALQVGEDPSALARSWARARQSAEAAEQPAPVRTTTHGRLHGSQDGAEAESPTRRSHAELENEVRTLRRTLDEVQTSTSWKLTAPMRTTVTRTRQVGRAGQAVRASMRYRGGLAPMVRAQVRSIRRMGLKAKLAQVRGLIGGDSRPGIPPIDQLDNYVAWIANQDRIDADALARLGPVLKAERANAEHPQFSIVMPVYKTPLDMLQRAVDSVRHQSVDDWELCIVDDASDSQELTAALADIAAGDPRIHVKTRATNGHISATSNDALAMATGDFVVLLDHDDELHPMALFWMAEEIRRHPDAALLYSDEDKIDEGGRRRDPYFKSDFNRELFYCQNMISHLGVYRRSLLEEIGGFREGYEGSQDYDLALRSIERIDPSHVRHVRKVLYHWRIHSASTASSIDAKPYAVIAGMRAIQDHFDRQQIEADLKESPDLPQSFYRVVYRIPDPAPSVEIIIPTRDRADLLAVAIRSILEKTAYPNYRICIVDNGSTEPAALALLDRCRENPRFRIVRDDGPFNFAALNNRAVDGSEADLVCLLNNDIEVTSPDWLAEMVGHAIQPGIGCVGARLWYPDGSLQHGGILLGIGGVGSHSHKGLPRGQYGYFGRAVLQQEFSAVTAACLVVRRATWEAVGGMDTDFAVAFNDVDFCLRVRALGLRNVWTPHAELVHHESASRGYDDSDPAKLARIQRELQRMVDRWGDVLKDDPFYSPHLTRDREDYSIAMPPV